MKLETKHIIPYLGYKLNFLIDGIVCEIEGIDLYQKDTIIAERVSYKLEKVKPILRPLCDMFKQIEVDGKKFIPEFIFDINCSTVDSPIYLSTDEKREYFKEFSYFNIREHHLPFMPYGMIDQLVSWHFDIFGLIEKGLAIDINKLSEDPQVISLTKIINKEINEKILNRKRPDFKK